MLTLPPINFFFFVQRQGMDEKVEDTEKKKRERQMCVCAHLCKVGWELGDMAVAMIREASEGYSEGWGGELPEEPCPSGSSLPGLRSTSMSPFPSAQPRKPKKIPSYQSLQSHSPQLLHPLQIINI